MSEQHRGQQQGQQQNQAAAQRAQQAAGLPNVEPGTKIPNPAEPYAPTVIPERAGAESFKRVFEQGGPRPGPGYPKLKYHPVHGGIEIKDAEEEACLMPKTDWFDTPELADAARTWTEAEMVRMHNLRAKLHELDDAGHPMVRNSVQSDEAIRNARIEPL